MKQVKSPLGAFCAGMLILLGLASWVLRPAGRDADYLTAGEFPFRKNRSSSDARRPPRAKSKIRLITGFGADRLAPIPASNNPYPVPAELQGVDLISQTAAEAAAKSWGCIECHKTVGDPHGRASFHLGCVDCHGGNASTTDMALAHVAPRFAGVFATSGNPVRSYTILNHERPEFIQFINPGDLRIAHLSCGLAGCHPNETLQVRKSMMTHGCMLWGAALYNNGAVPYKWARYGESYSMHGVPQRLQTVPPPTPEETDRKGILPFLDPMPRHQVSHPGNILRIFERGGRFIPEVGIPERREDNGKPRTRLSNRGLGTLNRTSPVSISLQKTRLLDPTLNFLGTNDNAGDYRSSGCTGCHVIYANDRSPVHSGPYAKYGNRGQAAKTVDGFIKSVDPMIPKNEPGHPIEHRFTRAIPTSQCIVCHVHPGTSVLNSYLGYLWWDQETDGEHLYPPEQRDPSSEEFTRSNMKNPYDGTALRLTSDSEFLAHVAELNPLLKKTQFADFHGHGWVFRSVFKKDREGLLVDYKGNRIENPSTAKLQLAILIPQYVKQLYVDRDRQDPRMLAKKKAELDKLRDQVPVHLMDIHLEKGMHCIDCHFIQDVHGDTKLYGEVRAAIEIKCIDCHGTYDRRAAMSVHGQAQMRTSGPAAAERGGWSVNGRNLTAMRTPFGKRRFEVRGKRIIQNSMVEKDLSWEVSQVVDTIDPNSPNYNPLSAIAKTVRFNEQGEFVWGDVPQDTNQCAHANQKMTCISCHSSWNPSCYGCHLPQKADKKMPELHNEGDVTTNYTAYNFQTLRDEVYMLAKDGNVTNNRISPVRSACAIYVGSYNKNRESIYFQQQTISAEGMSGIAFSTNVPHTVRGKGETKMCADCHLSNVDDNNALMAQLLMQGTNYLNFIGKYCWVASGRHGLNAVVVTERNEPQAVIGSSLHSMAFPGNYKRHVRHGRELEHAHEHPGNDIGENILRPFQKTEVLAVQHRGEYIYAACGEGGLRIYDIAFLDHKGFSERIVTAPVSPVGQRFFVRTKYAADVASPTTISPDPTRTRQSENHEAAVHPMYAYIYVADKYEGLILVGAGTLLDGNPTNNFVKRALTFNPDGILDGARRVTIVGTNAYVCCDAGLVVVSLDDPLNPVVATVIGDEFLHHPHAVEVQFRYGFVCDEEGLKILDTTDPAHPRPVSMLLLPEAHNVYVARTYAYVAAGRHGMIIVDVKNPLKPKVEQIFDADGAINDCHDIKLGITYTSEFAYVADGINGLRIVQLTSPETPGNGGFSPKPTPRLIATFKIPKKGHALSISKGMDRDRAIDESGNQLAVFGRVGARPLSLKEQRRLYLMSNGAPWKVMNNIRNYRIQNKWQREMTLQSDIERFYGPSRHPNRRGYNPPGAVRIRQRR